MIIDEDGIVQSISEQSVFGTIKDIAVLPWNEKFQVQNPKVCVLISLHKFMFGTCTGLRITCLIVF